MTDSAPRPEAALAASPPPLDEVMLAMDVVDVLRHHEALVAAELDDEARRRALVERVQAIYAGQGIEVPADVVERGVQALEQDRFRYRPPERTLSVRLAEAYVNRGWWARRAAVVLALVAVLVGGISWMNHRRDRAQIERYEARVASVSKQELDVVERARGLDARIAEERRSAPASGVVADLLHQAETALGSARTRIGEAKGSKEDAKRYPRAAAEMDGRLETRRRALGAASEDLGKAGGQIDAVERLRSLKADVARVLARLAGVTLRDEDRAAVDRAKSQTEAAVDAGDEAGAQTSLAALNDLVGRYARAVEVRRSAEAGLAAALAGTQGMTLDPAAKAEVDGLAMRARAALAAGDAEGAAAPVSELTGLVAELGLDYELRIVSREGENSGVWRYPANQPGVQTYYVIVDAIGRNGQRIAIPVKSEEDQSLRSVTTFGIRVSKAVWESVKADKLDNGIVDKNLFGRKRRGTREPVYEFAVAGGRITQWR